MITTSRCCCPRSRSSQAIWSADASHHLTRSPGAKTRRNLTLTLHAWLGNPGQRKAIADSLGVHPQTVRYRMAQLRELFGDSLDNADGRFELELALRLARYAAPGEDGED